MINKKVTKPIKKLPLWLKIVFGVLFILLIIIGGFYAYVDFFLSGKDWEIQSYSINKELDNLPPVDQWKEFVDNDFKISFKYPPEKWVVIKDTTIPSIKIEWNQWKGLPGTQINILKKSRQYNDDLIKIITETDKSNYQEFKISRLRKDFVEITDTTRSSTSDGVNRYILIQKEYIIDIQLMNYGRWTGNQKNLRFIYALDRGLNLVAQTIRTIE